MKLETEQDIYDRYIGRSVTLPIRERTERRKRTPVWELARLVEACRSAPIIWVGLCEAAAKHKRRRFGITREQLAKRSGILRLPTISSALAALERAGWIRRSHVYRGDGVTLLRVALLKIPPNLVRARTRKPKRRCERKTLATAAQGGVLVANDNRSSGPLGCERKTLALSVGESATSLARSGGAETSGGQVAKQKMARIELDDGDGKTDNACTYERENTP